MEETTINGKKYYLVEMSHEDLEEFINIGSSFSFHCNGKDYFVEGACFDNEAKGRVGYYYIADPNVQKDGACGDSQSEYAESRQAKTANEFMTLPFIDGKTIFERFDELRFFDI